MDSAELAGLFYSILLMIGFCIGALIILEKVKEKHE